MIRQLRKHIGKMTDVQREHLIDEVQSARLEHPIASETDWHPLSSQGNGRLITHQLYNQPNGSLIYRPSKQVNTLAMFLMLIGLAFPVITWLQTGWGAYLLAVASLSGFLFLTSAMLVYKRIGKVMHFNPENQAGQTDHDQSVIFAEVQAIQLLNVNHNRYTAHELNWVLKNTGRRQVLSHSSINTITEQASRIAKLINVPVWDATTQRIT
ncbi:hypothetical protein [Marinicella sediminis]|nr:hypothetical protein [Marinicella sediminis]